MYLSTNIWSFLFIMKMCQNRRIICRSFEPVRTCAILILNSSASLLASISLFCTSTSRWLSRPTRFLMLNTVNTKFSYYDTIDTNLSIYNVATIDRYKSCENVLKRV